VASVAGSVLSRRAFGAAALLIGCAAAPSAPRRETRRATSFDRLPRLPRVSLGTWPTPVEPAAELGDAIGVPRLYLKRDDRAGTVYGGGKVRKLEWLLAAARREGAERVVTFGGVGSNHAVATTLYARELGLRTVLFLLPEPPSEHLRQNLLACLRGGAELHLVGGEQAVAPSPRSMVIPAGGTCPLGNLGFVAAALELEAQVQSGVLPEPSHIYLPLGTMGCAVGLVLGLRLTRLRSRVVAVRASNVPTSTRERFTSEFDRTVAFLRARDRAFPEIALRGEDLEIESRHLGPGYGVPTREGRAALDLARTHGLGLEPTYTAKALAALIDAAPRLRRAVVLFWNTHSSRPLDVAGVDPAALPPAFRGYFAGT
jgi:D-cysteine desulfhydrase